MFNWIRQIFGLDSSTASTDNSGDDAEARDTTHDPESRSEHDTESREDANEAESQDGNASPLASDTTAREDLFNRAPFANRLADMIAMHSDPDSIVFGLYGEWGSGKTTALEQTEKILKKKYHNRVVSFWFNPWRFHDEALVLAAFMQRLAQALGKSAATGGERFAKFAKEKIVPLIPDVKVEGDITLNFADAFGRYADNWSKADLETLRDRVGEFLIKSNVRVAIFIDDIDRLDQTEIQTVFRLVKLTADFKNTAYVLAFDEVLAAQALAPRYGPHTEKTVGSSFLEKIVQVPLRIPRISQPRLVNYCFQEINRVLIRLQIELDEGEGQRFATYFSMGCGARVTTPRAAKRFANVLAFTLIIVQGEVNLCDFMLIEALHLFHPQIYKFIRNYPEIVLNTRTTSTVMGSEQERVAKEMLDVVLTLYPAQEREGLEYLLHELFPQTEGLSRNAFYVSVGESEWARGRRVVSPRFFDRYFAYAVGTDEVSECEIMEVTDIVISKDVVAIASAVARLVGERNQEDAMYAIGRVSESLDNIPAARLAQVLGRFGTVLHGHGRYGLGVSPRGSARKVIANLLSRIADPNTRAEVAESIMKDAEPLIFALEILTWIDDKRSVDKSTGIALYSESALKALRGIIVSRIRGRGIRDILDASDTDDSRHLIWAWRHYGDPAALSTSLTSLIASHHSYAIQLVKGLVPTVMSLETGVEYKDDFTRDHYETLSQLVDPQAIYSALQQQYGETVKIPPYDREEADVDKRLARQFAYVHLHRKSDAEA